MPRKAVFKGEDAIVVSAHDSTERTTNIGGQAHFHGAHFAGDVIAKDELHAHDVVNSVRRIPDNSRWAVSPAEVGTMFVLPSSCEVCLPPAPPANVPMRFELVGSNIRRASLKIEGGHTLFSPTSYVVYNGDTLSVLDEVEQEAGLQLANVAVLRLVVQSTVEHTVEGRTAYKYRVTGTVNEKRPSERTCHASDDIACECMVQKKKKEEETSDE